jgi:hypothetical protein
MKPTLNHEELIYVWKELFDISGSVRDVRIEMFGWRNSVRAILSSRQILIPGTEITS